jgi:hypothetical protein
MPPTIVSASNPVLTLKTSLYEFLSDYFDGDTHEVGDTSLVFPDCEIVFEVLPLEITKPVICILGNSMSEDKDYKCKNPSDVTEQKPGIEKRANCERILIVASPKRGMAEPALAKKKLDEIWGLLSFLFSTTHKELATRNIIRPSLPSFPLETLEKEDKISCIGILNFACHLSFGRYNIA